MFNINKSNNFDLILVDKKIEMLLYECSSLSNQFH